MEKVMIGISSFKYEPLVLTPEQEISDEEEYKGNINGVGPSTTITKKEELANLKGRNDSF
jgi:hypothetical protein